MCTYFKTETDVVQNPINDLFLILTGKVIYQIYESQKTQKLLLKMKQY